MKQHYGDESEEGEDSGVKGYMDLITFLDKVREYVVYSSGVKGYMDLITFLDKVRVSTLCMAALQTCFCLMFVNC